MDSGVLHVLEPADRGRFTDELASVLLPGGRYCLLGFRERRRWFFSRRGISEESLRARFAARNGWHVHQIQPAEFQTRQVPVPALRACIERLPRRAPDRWKSRSCPPDACAASRSPST